MADIKKYISDLAVEFERLSYNDMESCSNSERLLYLYAYYHYFNADNSKITDITQGNVFEWNSSDRITGIYIDQESDDTDVDLIIVNYIEEGEDFDFPGMLKVFKDAENAIFAYIKNKNLS